MFFSSRFCDGFSKLPAHLSTINDINLYPYQCLYPKLLPPKNFHSTVGGSDSKGKKFFLRFLEPTGGVGPHRQLLANWILICVDLWTVYFFVHLGHLLFKCSWRSSLGTSTWDRCNQTLKIIYVCPQKVLAVHVFMFMFVFRLRACSFERLKICFLYCCCLFQICFAVALKEEDYTLSEITANEIPQGNIYGNSFYFRNSWCKAIGWLAHSTRNGRSQASASC